MKKKRLAVKNRKQAFLRLALVLLAPAVVIAGIWGAVKMLQARSTAGSFAALPFMASDAYEYTGKGFLYVTGGKLCYKDDADPKADQSYSVSTESIRLAASQSISAVYNATAIQILGAEYPIEFSGELLDVKCGAEHIAALRQDGAGNISLEVFKKDATRVDNLDFSGSYLTNFGFSNTSAEILWTLTLDTSGEVLVQTLTTYDLSIPATTGVMSMQSQLVEDVFFTAKSILAVSTGNIIRYNLTGNTEVYRQLVYGWELSDSEFGASTLFLMRPRKETSWSSVRIYKLTEDSADSVFTVHLPDGVLNVFFMGERVAAFTQNKVYLYSLSGKFLSEMELAENIDMAQPLSGTKALVTVGNGLYTVEVKS